MSGLTSLILGSTFEETLCNVIGLLFIIEFIGCVLSLVSNIRK